MTTSNKQISQQMHDHYTLLDIAIKSLEMVVAKQSLDTPMPCELHILLHDRKTVIANGGRQIGKTQWIATNSGRDDLILCFDSYGKDYVNQNLDELKVAHKDRPLVVYPGELKRNLKRAAAEGTQIKSTPFRKVFVDDASYTLSRHGNLKFYKDIEHLCSFETLFYLIG